MENRTFNMNNDSTFMRLLKNLPQANKEVDLINAIDELNKEQPTPAELITNSGLFPNLSYKEIYETVDEPGDSEELVYKLKQMNQEKIDKKPKDPEEAKREKFLKEHNALQTELADQRGYYDSWFNITQMQADAIRNAETLISSDVRGTNEVRSELQDYLKFMNRCKAINKGKHDFEQAGKDSLFVDKFVIDAYGDKIKKPTGWK